MQYITFDEYKNLGGNVTDEATFISLQRQIESRMNYITFGRIDKMLPENAELRETVSILEVELINVFSGELAEEKAKTGIQSYSNGIESITYAVSNTDIEKQRNGRIYTTMQSFLYKFPELFYRGRC